MSKAVKWAIGLIVVLGIMGAAVAGVLAWKNQDLRSSYVGALASQATPAGVNDVPVMPRPLMRMIAVIPWVLEADEAAP